MYMSGFIEKCSWAESLCGEVLKADKACTLRSVPITFYLPLNGVRSAEITGGHYSSKKGIELLADNLNKTPFKLWVMLHEIGHAIHNDIYGPAKPMGKGKRHDHHPNTFWGIVIPLFDRYGVLDIALDREYVRGKKAIKSYKKL